MSEYPLRDAIFDAEDNLRRARDFAQVMVDAVESRKLGKRGPGSGIMRLAYEVLDCTDAAIEDWSKMFGLVTQRDTAGDKPPLKAVGDGGPRP
jgi:hypothetical protein